MSYKRKQLPKYCHHKATNRAFVRIGGKMYYLGKYGSEASRREYDRIIGEFVANGRQTFQNPDEILIETLIVRFLDYAETEQNYCESSKIRFARVLSRLNRLYGKQLVSQFGPAALKSIRRQYLEEGKSLDTINGYIGIIKQVFYWGDEEGIVPVEVTGALRTMKMLQKGRSAAKENAPVEPVADEIVEKTLPHICRPEVWDMIRVQRLIAGRPQDVCNLRFCDIDRNAEIWKYEPFTHKTKKKGKTRILPIGPRAQKILQKYFDQWDGGEQFIFLLPRGKPYTTGAYGKVIADACKTAGVPHWSPNQLRHAGGTEVREKFGLDAAQAVMGHSSASIGHRKKSATQHLKYIPRSRLGLLAIACSLFCTNPFNSSFVFA